MSIVRYVIRYTDGLYESGMGMGWACDFEEAKYFETREEAEERAEQLIDVDCIVEVVG